MKAASIRLEELARDNKLNFKRIYDTTIVYGDLSLEGLIGNVIFPTPKLWVKGDFKVADCIALKSLPLDEIEANSVHIENCAALNDWPKRLVADTVHIQNVMPGHTLDEVEIISCQFYSDHPNHNPDTAQIFGQRIISRGQTIGIEVVDESDRVLWRRNANELLALTENGYLKNYKDTAEVQSLLVELGVIEHGSRVYKIDDALSAWDKINKHKEHINNFGSGFV